MSRVTIDLDSAFIVELGSPIDVVNDNPLDVANDSAASSMKMYDPGKDTVLVSAIATTAVLPIDPAGQFAVGDVLEVTEDSGTLTEGIVLSVDTTLNTVTTDTAVTAAAAGNRVRAVFGTAGSVSLTMDFFGVAVSGSLTYGFRASIPFNHARMHFDNQEVDIEIRFIGDPAAGGPLNALFVVCAIVKRVCAE